MTTTPGEFKRTLQTRRHRQHRTRWTVLGSGFFVLLLAGIITQLVWLFSVFTATEVRANGLSLLTKQQVTDTAAVELDGPFAAQDVDAIHDWVATLAPVAKVRMERHFPHVIEITVIKRIFTYVWIGGNAARRVGTNGMVLHGGRETIQGIVKADIAVLDQHFLKDMVAVVSAMASMSGDQIILLQTSAVNRVKIQLSDRDTVV